jgi:uncharacterized peroxidase-related enzyme
MNRLPVPAAVEETPAASQPLLAAVHRQLGSVPNLFRLLGQSPASLEGYLGLSGALGKGALDVRTRNRLALTVAEANGCDYCLSAHTALGRSVARLTDEEMAANRDAASGDAKATAALRFARQVVLSRGHVTDEEVAAVQAAGFSPPEVLEIVLHVALNTLTNYVNTVAQTAIDFPVVAAGRR